MLLVAVAVVAVAGFCVYRLHGIFGSHHSTSAASAISNDITPFNPKHVILEVFGATGHCGNDQLPGCQCSAAES